MSRRELVDLEQNRLAGETAGEPLQLLALDGKPTRAEPATVRSKLLDIPAKLTERARRRELKFDTDWPASYRAIAVWDRIQALSDPG
ncbi:hypothetical protein ACIQMR_31405 [Streptomyces sp. NPDC091376]|uniref:hypothetical protein n=1 Tax=Streptomyces sp. NPDC091376 TaxID=3365994 RepID=UPI00380046C3